jgi:hypothetical protein
MYIIYHYWRDAKRGRGGHERRKTLQPDRDEAEEQEREQIPVMQRVLDNPFLLLFIGITVPTVFYIIWGVMEIVTIPLAP